MQKDPSAKYRPFPPVALPDRQWPNRVLTQAPRWCSVDLRDGNQALAVPMNVSQKLELFHTLVKCGFKEIEVGFPSASNTEFTFNRRLIEELCTSGIFERSLVLSFSLPRLQAVKAVEPSIPIGWITMAKLCPNPLPEVLGPFWPGVFLNPFFVRRAHRRGQVVCPLDPTPDGRLWYYKLLKCDAIVTDNPGATLEALQRISYK